MQKESTHVGSFCFVFGFCLVASGLLFYETNAFVLSDIVELSILYADEDTQLRLNQSLDQTLLQEQRQFHEQEQFVVPSNYLNFKLMDKNIVLSKIRMILPRRYIWQSCKTVAQSHGLFRTL